MERSGPKFGAERNKLWPSRIAWVIVRNGTERDAWSRSETDRNQVRNGTEQVVAERNSMGYSSERNGTYGRGVKRSGTKFWTEHDELWPSRIEQGKVRNGTGSMVAE